MPGARAACRLAPDAAAGLADVVGRRLGKNNKLPFNKSKSYAGSAAMFLGSLGFAVACVHRLKRAILRRG